MDTQPDKPTDTVGTSISDAAFREHQAIRVAEAVAAFAETRALTCAQISTLQTASRSAGNLHLRGIAAHVLDLWADEREPALAALVAGNSCDASGDEPVISARELRPATDAEVASLMTLPPRPAGENVLFFNPFRDRKHWDPLDTGRPCDTEEPRP